MIVAATVVGWFSAGFLAMVVMDAVFRKLR